jgi:two-component sensor histidine kinase
MVRVAGFFCLSIWSSNVKLSQNHSYVLFVPRFINPKSVTVLLLLFSLRLMAEPIPFGRLPSQLFTPSEIGLRFSTRTSQIVQGGDNCMYVSSNEGIFRYDGVRWTLKTLPEDMWATSLWASGKDKLLCNTTNGIHSYDLKTGSFEPCQLEDENPVPKPSRLLTSDEQNYLFTPEAVFLQNRHTGLFEKIPFQGKIRGAHKGYLLYYNPSDKQYYLDKWVDGKLSRIGTFAFFHRIKAFWVSDSNSAIAYAVSTTRIHEIDLENGTANSTNVESHGFEFSDAIRVSDEQIAFKTSNDGVFLANFDGDIVERIHMGNSMLPNDSIAGLATDHQGGLWITTLKGILRVQLDSRIRFIDKDYKHDAYINDIYHSGDQLYTATQSGWVRYTKSPDTFTVDSQIKNRSNGEIWNIENVDGTLMTCGMDAPLDIDLKPLDFPRLKENWHIKEIEYQPDSRRLYLTTYERTYVYKKRGEAFIYLTQSSSYPHYIYKTSLDASGNLWVNALNGRILFASNTAISEGTMAEPFNFGVFEDIPAISSTTLEVGTEDVVVASGNTVFVADGDTMTSHRLTIPALETHPESALITRISHLEKHTYLLSVVENRSNFHLTIDSRSGRLASGWEDLRLLNNFKYIVSEKDAFGNLWCFSEQGAAMINLSAHEVQPPIACLSVSHLIMGNRKILSNSGSTTQIALGKLPPDSNNIDLEIKFPSYLANYGELRSNTFFLTINDDPNTRVSNTNGIFSVRALRPDAYKIKIEAIDALGRQAQPVFLSFEILPPWYQSVWAYVLYLVLISAAFSLILMWRLQVQRDRLWLERLESERRLNLETAAKDAQIQALRLQLNPHFLFNSLTLIANKLEKHSEAREAILRLSSFLRHALEEKNAHHIPLEKEIEAIHQYLAIEHMKSSGCLEVSFHIDPDTRNVPVPGLIIQPLVENAIKYATLSESGKKNLSIKSFISDEYLIIHIANSGAWKSGLSGGTSIGLDNIRRRLKLEYGDQAMLKTPDTQETTGSVTVQLHIPLKS